MTTPTPTRTGPTPCQGSTLECFCSAVAVVALVPLGLWVLADPVLAAAVGATVALVSVALVGLLARD